MKKTAKPTAGRVQLPSIFRLADVLGYENTRQCQPKYQQLQKESVDKKHDYYY